ncbi:MAG: thrombospondin type 3 repeat-containing protein [Flavobacteriales bacterium]
MHRLWQLFLVLVACCASVPAVQAQSQDRSVLASCVVQSSPPRITINWSGWNNVTGYQIFRKVKGGTNWGSAVATLDASALSWTDNNVTVGTNYEYRILRTTQNLGNGYCYINSGIEVPLVEARGKIILLVDDQFTGPLSTELAQLQSDLEGDGWIVLRHDVSRTASVPSIKSIVVADYNSDRANVKALFNVGHVPVPYSGNLAPDGHSEHYGAWAADAFYADVDGTWTDNSVNSTGASNARNYNVPGDGKYDQSIIPSAVELAVGRVDFHDLPSFNTRTETDLMRTYLNKLHAWKVKGFTAASKGLVDDNFTGMADAYAQNGYRGFAPLVGYTNVAQEDYFTTMASQSRLWSYGCGGGWWDNASGIGSSAQFASSELKSVFTILFGSYFGDFDAPNDFMRAALASGTTLTCFWAGYPNWVFHHMGLGETIGFAEVLTQNNTNNHYDPNNNYAGRVHIALLGDPTLRMTMVAPPANVRATALSGSTASIQWAASSDGPLLGYHVYRWNGSGWERRTSAPVSALTFTDNTAGLSGTVRYMVRALKLETTPSGSYQNLSLGSFGTLAISGSSADCQGIVGGPALPGTSCNDGDVCTTGDAWNSNCQCVGTYRDSDGDGICDGQDNCPNVAGQIGSSCNDGQACTVNDVLNSNCQCVGTMQDDDGDGICNAQDNCPNVPGQIGSSCNDGNPCTIGDVLNSDCQCVGTYRDSDGDGICDAQDNCPNVPGQIGSSCNDGNVCTVGDVLNSNCQCVGTYQDSDGDGICDAMDSCPNVPGRVGSGCNDGNACTINDVLNSNCQCVGTPSPDSDGDGICDAADSCPNVVGQVGSRCDDGDPCTINDALNANCQCAGTYQDSDGDGVCDAQDECPNVAGQIGSSCDDGNDHTANDVVNGDCQCVGEPVDCLGVLNGPAMPGTPCDDDDPSTGDDRWQDDCLCHGLVIDCLGVPGGTASYDECGVCNGNSDCLQGAFTVCTPVSDRSNGDVEEDENGFAHTTSSTIDLVYDSGFGHLRGNQHVGLWFPRVAVPQGVRVVRAYVQFTSRGTTNVDPCGAPGLRAEHRLCGRRERDAFRRVLPHVHGPAAVVAPELAHRQPGWAGPAHAGPCRGHPAGDQPRGLAIEQCALRQGGGLWCAFRMELRSGSRARRAAMHQLHAGLKRAIRLPRRAGGRCPARFALRRRQRGHRERYVVGRLHMQRPALGL